MPVATAAPASQGLSGRDIPTLDSLYEAAAGVNFTPGWVSRKKRILWSEPRPEYVPAHWSYDEKFEMTINLRTAKALNLEMPPNMVALAGEVLE